MHSESAVPTSVRWQAHPNFDMSSTECGYKQVSYTVRMGLESSPRFPKTQLGHRVTTLVGHQSDDPSVHRWRWRPRMTTTTSANPAVPEPRERTVRRTLYRGDPGMWSWVLHRISGATIFFFLFVHVLDTALVRVSPEAYNDVINTYKTPIVGLMEIGLVAAGLYHA